MKRLASIGLLIVFMLSASLVFAEDQVPKANPPSAAEQAAPAQPAPAAEAPAPAPELKPDPTGANTGGIGDMVDYSANGVTADDMKAIDNIKKTEPFAVKIADSIGKNRIAINIVWTLVCGFLVMFMQAGFAMAETGFTQAKNAGHTMAMNFMVYGLGLLGFWICGFGLQMGGAGPFATLGGGGTMNGEFTISLFGKDFGLFGTKGFFLGGAAYDAAIYTMFLFQMVFMDTTATIPTGSMAERWTMKSFIIYAFFISGIVYPLYANWVWGGGWLSALGHNFGLGHGHVDFAGSSVVHLTGGMAALAGAIVLGPRLGKFGPDGKPRAIPGHHIPMAVVGCFILAFGWFGFNAGSSLAGSDFRIGVVATNTMLAGGAASFSSWLYMWFRYGKPDISMSANGLLAGLVAITAPCAFVTSLSAVIIGAIAGVLVCVSIFFIERVLKVDDPVGAVSVHGVNGAWGVLALGLFADGTYGDGLNGVAGTVKGLFYGDASQFFAQVVGTVTNMIFVFVVMYVFFKVLDLIVPLRVDPELEMAGLDQAEVAVTAYPDFQTRHSHR
jgi:Amt family ammonium transporter